MSAPEPTDLESSIGSMAETAYLNGVHSQARIGLKDLGAGDSKEAADRARVGRYISGGLMTARIAKLDWMRATPGRQDRTSVWMRS
jgi:hypothetical protein